MTELAVWLVFGTFILAVFVYAWPIFVLIGAVCIVGWIAKNCLESIDRNRCMEQDRNAALVARADQQHQQIMSGDEIGGTYGIYQPPVGLR